MSFECLLNFSAPRTLNIHSDLCRDIQYHKFPRRHIVEL